MRDPVLAGVVALEVLAGIGERLAMLNPGRKCSVCAWKGKDELAVSVATDADGLQWFECANHSTTDNVNQAVRVRLEPIDPWFAAIPELAG